MWVQLDNEQYLGDLITFLEHEGYRVERVSEREIAVAPVPSSKRFDVMHLELDLLLHAWEAGHQGASAVCLIQRP
jgi:hypothetical protein